MERITTSALQYRRTVALDIETVAIDAGVPRGALDALTGRIVCIGLVVDDGAQLTERAIASENELQILSEFWNIIHRTDVLVGHNIHEFDLPFIRQRSWIQRIRPSRTVDLRKYYTVDVRDTLQIWTNWGFKKQGVTLDALGAALGCGQKSGHGYDVAQWWVERDLESIRRYCIEDVRLTYRVYCRLMYQEPRRQTKQAGAEISLKKQLDTTGPKRRRTRNDSRQLPLETSA